MRFCIKKAHSCPPPWQFCFSLKKYFKFRCTLENISIYGCMYVGNVTEYYKHFHRHSIPKPMVLELDFLFSNIILIKKNKGTKSVCKIEEKVCIVTTYKVYRWHKATVVDIVYATRVCLHIVFLNYSRLTTELSIFSSEFSSLSQLMQQHFYMV